MSNSIAIERKRVKVLQIASSLMMYYNSVVYMHAMTIISPSTCSHAGRVDYTPCSHLHAQGSRLATSDVLSLPSTHLFQLHAFAYTGTRGLHAVCRVCARA